MNVTAIKLTPENIKLLAEDFIERSIVRSGTQRLDIIKPTDVIGNFLVMVDGGPIIISSEELFRTYNITKRFKGSSNGYELSPKVKQYGDLQKRYSH